MAKNQKTRKELWRGRRGRTQKQVAKSDLNRLTVFRSAKHIYAQIDDPTGKTLATVSTRCKAVVGDVAQTGGVEAAKLVGSAIAGLAKDKKIEQVVFNRNGYLYHGRVKALADAAREAGLKF
ncbi:MAG: 50S ribosomal protein L18 [Deltaproteobacteria bacterium]|nr:50S ribosomal protein L18 [Deltaproteobacteria bacterium]